MMQSIDKIQIKRVDLVKSPSKKKINPLEEKSINSNNNSRHLSPSGKSLANLKAGNNYN
jgi:hypothetical protein